MKTSLFSAALFVLFCLAMPVYGQGQSASDLQHVASIRAAYQALNERNWDAFAARCDVAYRDLNVGPSPVSGIGNAIGLYQQFAAGFPDFRIEIQEIAPAGNRRYLLRVRVTGTHTGAFMGIAPTNKPIAFDDADVVELNAEGKIISHAITNTGEPLVQIGHASMLNPATHVVIATYEKFGAGDVAGILAMCEDQVLFEIEDRVFDDRARRFSGKEGVGDFFGELAQKAQYTLFQPLRFVADGNDVFVLVQAHYTHLPTGKTYASSYTHHFRITNGRIAYFRGLDGFAKDL